MENKQENIIDVVSNTIPILTRDQNKARQGISDSLILAKRLKELYQLRDVHKEIISIWPSKAENRFINTPRIDFEYFAIITNNITTGMMEWLEESGYEVLSTRLSEDYRGYMKIEVYK